jgi:hypothetical protein
MLGTDKRDNDAAFNAAFWPGDCQAKGRVSEKAAQTIQLG